MYIYLRVSIPFIAGQWSLRLHRTEVPDSFCIVSIPFIAGQWSLLPAAPVSPPRPERVSIPFIAGQWSLHAVGGDPLLHGVKFQSPSLRGSGRFRAVGHAARERRMFQSPSLRGSGRFKAAADEAAADEAGFNPLHCGAVVASGGPGHPHEEEREVSIPFIAGQWSLPEARVDVVQRITEPFQSPSLRGSGRFINDIVGLASPPLVSIPFIAGQWSLLPRTTPSSLFGVLLRKRRLPCDHIICTRLPF